MSLAGIHPYTIFQNINGAVMQSLFSKLDTRRICGLAAAIAIVFFFAARVQAQSCGGSGVPGSFSNAGTEFLVCFMQNYNPDWDPLELQRIYLASISDMDDTITITCKNFPMFSQTLYLRPRGKGGDTVTFEANHNSFISWPRSGIINTDEIIDSTVFRVVATSPIICYGLNSKQYTADAFICLPDTVNLYDYMVLSYYNSNHGVVAGGDEQPSEFCVAAFKDNTVIEVTCKAQTQNGVAAGIPTRYTLNAGTAIQFQAARLIDSADLTGSTVKVISGGRIAVYGGHSRTEVPTHYSNPDGVSTSRDHIADAMPPTADWGCSFIAKNFGRPQGDMMRVLALNDNTVVKINGTVWGAPLMSGKFRDTLIANSQVALNNIIAVESNAQHPLLVGMLAHTAGNDGLGDPFLAIVPPLTQGYNDFTYFNVNDTKDFDPNENFLIVVTERSAVGKITIDPLTPQSFTIPAQSFTNIPMPLNGLNLYSVATLNQPSGIHRILGPAKVQGNTAQGFSILAYGWGHVISYGYTAGALFTPQSGIGCIPPPPGSGNPPPSIKVRDLLSEPIYFDSAKITYSQNKSNNIVRLKKDIVFETGYIEPTEEKTLELTTMKPLDDVIKGTVRIWYHSALWTDLNPVDFPFTIVAQGTAAGVNGEVQKMRATLENYPNPSPGKSTITFSIPSRSFASVKIYDALGRLVRIVSESTIDEGLHAFPISGLSSGSYTIELSAPEIGVSEHRKMIVM